MKEYMGKNVGDDGLIGEYQDDKNDYLDLTNKNFAFGRTVFTGGTVIPWMRTITEKYTKDALPNWDKENQKWTTP